MQELSTANCPKPGRLIVLEGLDGSGKTTQARLLYERMRAKGLPVRQIKFPNYEEPSSALAQMYLKGELGKLEEINAYAASSFYSVDRYATYQRQMKTDYLAGCSFVFDRYTTANMVHQTTKEPKENWNKFLDWLEDFEYNKLGLPRPSLVIYLDMEPSASQKMLTERYHGDESQKDIHEANLQYLLACREAALYAAEKFGWTVIKCSDEEHPLPIEQIAQRIDRVVMP